LCTALTWLTRLRTLLKRKVDPGDKEREQIDTKQIYGTASEKKSAQTEQNKALTNAEKFESVVTTTKAHAGGDRFGVDG
jgi:hypothetical protein